MHATHVCRALVLFVITALVSACGGDSGGGGDAHSPPSDTPPVASFTVTPSSGSAPLTVQFDASASTDTGGSIRTYNWTFGDNSAAVSGVTASHDFLATGTYDVTLTVTDDGGATGSTTHQVTINAPVGGWWVGTTEAVEPMEMLGLVAEDGRAYFLKANGMIYWGTIRSSGDQISGQLGYAPMMGMGWPESEGLPSRGILLYGSIQERASIAATLEKDNFVSSFGATLAYHALYDDDSSLALIAGNYVDALGIYGGVLNIASNGSLFLQDPVSGCVISGQIAVINAAYNVYDVQLSYGACADSMLNGLAFSGLASYDAESDEVIALVHAPVDRIANAFLFDRQ